MNLSENLFEPSLRSTGPRPVLQQLGGQLWRARQLDLPRPESQPTGYQALDQTLAAGGWPRQGLVELLLPRPGIGELRLLAPALAKLSQQSRWLLWVNPPQLPYAPALAAMGIDISKILMVHTKQHQDALWTLEQALKSGTCAAALGWLDERQLDNSRLRRLQLAARQGDALVWLCRPDNAANQASMAALRLRLGKAATATDSLQLTVLKQPGGWAGAQLQLELQPALPQSASQHGHGFH